MPRDAVSLMQTYQSITDRRPRLLREPGVLDAGPVIVERAETGGSRAENGDI